MADRGIFHAYGLFWRADEIDWTPGAGARSKFRLIGRRGENRPTLRMADFRHQQGIYILYGNYGPHYVGLTRAQGLGKRLKDHRFDNHENQWDRFSWFSFGQVLASRDESGLQCFRKIPRHQAVRPKSMIGDIEALLMRAMDVQNVAQMKFAEATQWHQVKLDEIDHYMAKLR